jgi:hypothetical protein
MARTPPGKRGGRPPADYLARKSAPPPPLAAVAERGESPLRVRAQLAPAHHGLQPPLPAQSGPSACGDFPRIAQPHQPRLHGLDEVQGVRARSHQATGNPLRHREDAQLGLRSRTRSGEGR